MRKVKVFLAVLAVLLTASFAAAQTTMTINGFIRVYPELNNYGYGAVGYSADSKATSFVDQRARLFFNVKSGDNVGGTVAFEIDSRWGDAAYQPARENPVVKDKNNKDIVVLYTRNTGGALEADTVNVETKNAYLWFKPNNDLKLTLGIQGYTDDFKGIILGGADAAGIRADYSINKDSSLMVGWYLFQDPSAATGTSDAVWFLPISYKMNLGDGKLGLAYYRLQDGGAGSINAPGNKSVRTPSSNGAQINYLGANYAGKAGDVSYSAFLVYNFGTIDNYTAGKDADISAFAFNADAAMKLGDGKIKAALLYASGDKSTTDYNGFVTGNQYSNGADLPLMQNDLYLILRTLDDISHSVAFFEDIRNGGLGATVVYATYDQNISDKTNVQVALGYGKANEKNASNPNLNLTPSIKEINAQAAYKFDKSLTIKAAAAYGMLSDVKVGTKDADNLYRLMMKFQYAF